MKRLVFMFAGVLLLAAGASSGEPPKPTAAVINLNAILSNNMLSPRLAILSLEPAALPALQELSGEIKTVQSGIAQAANPTQRNALQARLQFLQRKHALLLQLALEDSRERDAQKSLRKFLIATYKDQYSLILQPEALGADAMLWHGGLEIRDITEEASAKVREYLDEAWPDPLRGPSSRHDFASPARHPRFGMSHPGT